MMKLFKDFHVFPDTVRPDNYEYFRLAEMKESIDRSSLVLVDRGIVLRSMRLKHRGYLSVSIKYSNQIVSMKIAETEIQVKIKVSKGDEVLSRTRNYKDKTLKIDNLLYLLLAKDDPDFKDVERLYESIEPV